MHELPDLSRLSVAEKNALILEQFQWVPHLIALVQALSARVRAREGVAQGQSPLQQAAAFGRVGQEAQIAAPIQRAPTGRAGRACENHVETRGQRGGAGAAPAARTLRALGHAPWHACSETRQLRVTQSPLIIRILL